MKTSFVARFPTPLEAEHLYPPSSVLLMFVSGIVTILLSVSFIQVVLGAGLPLAVQVRVKSFPSLTV